VKKRGSRKRGGVPDGKDVDAFDSQIPKAYLQTRSEVWRRSPMVGFMAQIRSRNGAIAGVTNQFDESVADQLEELARDIEKELLSNQDSTPEADGGIHTRGVGRWLHNSSAAGAFPAGVADTLTVDTASGDPSPTTGFYEMPIPDAYQIPANQVYTGSIASMDETDNFAVLLNNKWGNTGASSELVGFVTQTIKNKVNQYAWYRKEVPGFTPTLQISGGRVDGKKLFGESIDIYVSDWGTFRMMPVPVEWMPTAYTGYFLDMKQVKLRVTENVVQMELPNLGGGPREMIQSILGLEMGDPRAHAKINGTA